MLLVMGALPSSLSLWVITLEYSGHVGVRVLVHLQALEGCCGRVGPGHLRREVVMRSALGPRRQQTQTVRPAANSRA